MCLDTYEVDKLGLLCSRKLAIKDRRVSHMTLHVITQAIMLTWVMAFFKDPGHDCFAGLQSWVTSKHG